MYKTRRGKLLKMFFYKKFKGGEFLFSCLDRNTHQYDDNLNIVDNTKQVWYIIHIQTCRTVQLMIGC